MTPADWKDRLEPLAPSRRAWGVALAAIAALYVAGVPSVWVPTPDSALYLSLGRSLATGDGYSFNGATNDTVTPGLPMILAGLHGLTGGSIYAANLLIALMGLGALAVTVAIAREFAGSFVAFFVLLATALSYPVFRSAHVVLTDTPFALCAALAILAALRLAQGRSWAWLALAIAAAAAGAAIRAPGVLLLGPLAIGVALDRSAPGRNRLRRGLAAAAILASTSAVIGGMWLLARSIETGEQPPMYASFAREQMGSLEHVAHNLLLGAAELPRSISRLYSGQEFPPFGILVFVLAAWGGVRSIRAGRWLLPITAFAYVLALAVAGGRIGVRSRYLQQVWPILAILAALGIADLVGRVVARRRNRPATSRELAIAVGVLLGLGIAINTPRTLRDGLYYSTASHFGRYYDVIREGRHKDLFAVAQDIRESLPDDALVLAGGDDVSMLHYLTGRLFVRTMQRDPFLETPLLTEQDVLPQLRTLDETPQAAGIVVDLEEGDAAYRQAWIEAAERRGLTIVAPQRERFLLLLVPADNAAD